jgi:hypothetical protein
MNSFRTAICCDSRMDFYLSVRRVASLLIAPSCMITLWAVRGRQGASDEMPGQSAGH